MASTILLLGHTGKLGSALYDIFSTTHNVIGKNSLDFDATKFNEITDIIENIKPDYIINTIGFLGIDHCEQNHDKAILLNTLFPRHLAILANKRKITLVHFSTDAVFNDSKGDYYNENDRPAPLNIYGVSKYGGDCLVAAECTAHYIFRIPVLFGNSNKNDQFVEKMLFRIKEGQKVLKISDDIVSSPTYSRDVATAVKELLFNDVPYGLYHIANDGKASLFELMEEIKNALRLDVVIERTSFKSFPFVGTKNTYTPLASIRTGSLRHWKDAIHDYACFLKEKEQK